MSLDNLKENKTALFGITLITSLLGGLLLILDDFSGWYWSAGIYGRGWGWIGIPSLLENLFEGSLEALIFLPIFLAVAGALGADDLGA